VKGKPWERVNDKKDDFGKHGFDIKFGLFVPNLPNRIAKGLEII